MTTEEIIIYIFCYVDDNLPKIQKHSQAKLYPSELVTIGILFALRGGHFRALLSWLKRERESLFGGLPHRTRLLRLLKTHQAWCSALLAKPSFFTVMDTYPIELLFPIVLCLVLVHEDMFVPCAHQSINSQGRCRVQGTKHSETQLRIV